MNVHARVDSVIRVDVGALPGGAWKALTGALTFPNHEREVAMRERVRGAAAMPTTVRLWQPDGTLPRGFALQMRKILGAAGHEVTWEDARQDAPVFTGKWKPVAFAADREYQEHAVARMQDVQQGMWQAPPGAGKTVAVLELIRRTGQRACVIVNTSNIARQWVERAEQFIGYTPGVVGDGEFEVGDITIALQQTLWSRRVDFDESGFWSLFGMVCLDECHHLPATTYTEIVQRFPARYRLGVSGTPDLQQHALPTMEATIGKLFHVTKREELVKSGVLRQPSVRVKRTDFDFDYFPTHDHTPGAICTVEFCTGGRGARRHGNNYGKMMSAIVADADRNWVISRDIYDALVAGRTVLVLSKRLAHLETLKRLTQMHCEVDQQSFTLVDYTGQQASEERMRINALADFGGMAIFSTIGNEALDIPRIDTVVLAWPTANPKIVEQQVGRAVRVHDAKNEPLILDYSDSNVGVLRRQYLSRLRELYRPQGFKVDDVSAGELVSQVS
jgi:superfamily II DNA or RNA helicase